MRAVTRKSVRERALQTAGWYLGRDEQAVGTARVWVTDVRDRVPLLFRQRSFFDLVVSDQRVVLLARPRRFKSPFHRRRPQPDGPLVAARHSAFSIVHLRRYAVLLQLRLRSSGARDLVIEFRPVDRPVAAQLIGLIRSASPAMPAA